MINHKMFLLALLLGTAIPGITQKQPPPNVIYIYADDLGYGDLSCYGATKISTPNIDKLAKGGIRFTNGHCTSATCTPSRYAWMTGRYPWRRNGTGILPGDAALIIPADSITLPLVFKQNGYRTGIVGKWHLGLGNTITKNWNQDISPGPNEVGFDYSFIFPATADRVPTVFMENHRVIGLDEADSIEVNYRTPVGNDPTGKDHPELLKMKASVGHNQTIVNGIGRIGYMSGGHKARWTDEEIPLTFLAKAKEFIETNKARPFFLCYTLTEPHVPRMPATMFKGKSPLGYRGDVILQLDWAVGEIMKELELLGIAKNTLIIFSSDNGPVLDDGYQDEAKEKLNGHTPAGVLRGGKTSIYEGGTRVPFIVSWPAKVKPGVSDALVCQIDLVASFSHMFSKPIPANQAPDSENVWNALLGQAAKGREMLVEHNGGAGIALVKGDWKYIGPVNQQQTPIQLYDLKNDLGEKDNVAEKYPDKVKEMRSLLEQIKQKNP